MLKVQIGIFLVMALTYIVYADTNELIVITYNIHHGEGIDGKIDLDRIADVVRAQNPHIVCFQEVDRNLPRTNHMDMPKLLSEKLGMAVLFEPNYKFDGGDYGNAIFTNLPVVNTENIALPNPISAEPRGCLVAALEWQGRKIMMMNTHLGLNGQERLAQAEAIQAKLENGPVILAGDMNEHITAPGMQVLTQKLKDTFEKNTGTLHATIPVQQPVRRIDFIFVSGEWEIISFEIIQNEMSRIASDHLPCTTKIQLKEGSGTKD